MVWVFFHAPYLLVKNFPHCVVLIDIVLVRQLFSKVSYALWFSSSISIMTLLVVLLINVIIM